MAPLGLAAVTRSAYNAGRLGQGVAKKAGFLFAGLQVLDWWEQYTDIEDDMAKMAKMEKCLIARMEMAKKTLENAKRSPCLAQSESVKQLEASMDEAQKFLDYVASCGPMLRGASKKKFIGKFARFGGFVTDALVAVQTDMMLTFTTHGGDMGRMQPPQVTPQEGLDPRVGGASGQMLAPTGQNENALAGQYSQPLLMPPPTLPSLPLRQQAVPPELAHGTPTIFPTPTAQKTPHMTGESAAPNGSVGWAPTSEAAFPVLHRRAASTGALDDFGWTEWPDNLGGISLMAIHQTPGARGREIRPEERGWPNNPEVISSAIQRGPAIAEGAQLGYGGAGWSNLPDGVSRVITHNYQARESIDSYNGRRHSTSEFVSPTVMDNASLAAADVPTGYDGARLSNNINAGLPMMYNPSVAVGTTTISDSVNPFSRTPIRRPQEEARNGIEGVAWTNLGNMSLCRSRPDTAPTDSEEAIPSMPQCSTFHTGQNISGTGIQGSRRSNPPDSISHATKQLRGALGIDGPKMPNSSDQVSQWTRQTPGVLRQESAEWINLSDRTSHAPQQMTRVPGPQIYYDSTGCSYYFDADTGQCYPAK